VSRMLAKANAARSQINSGIVRFRRRPIGGLKPVVQVRDAYCCSRRFSLVWCETSPVQIKGLLLVLPI